MDLLSVFFWRTSEGRIMEIRPSGKVMLIGGAVR
jgi:hypothetical protein